ncbi:ABC transporter permease [Yinghuangia sp. ASG 101]|uniref:ABC transporter permease n=1 Tax=Yinghuangia sp. ASG 101 TaxID=2896848 RepID=UPI001E654E5C|nr:ABC transporter permease [Yinghuangia sp. ASG 101]UGQ13410.1 ABC transporter permease [Yinghuangia sp. ASG 101]
MTLRPDSAPSPASAPIPAGADKGIPASDAGAPGASAPGASARGEEVGRAKPHDAGPGISAAPGKAARRTIPAWPRITARLRDAALRPGLVLAVAWLVVVVLAGIAPEVFSSTDPLAVDPSVKLHGPSWDHPFGTDSLGRDQYARLVHGAGVSLLSALIATGVGLITGALLGLLAGFLRGVADLVIMRVADMLLSVPALLLSLALIAALGPGTRNAAIAVGVASIATCARIMRSEVLSIRESRYVDAARSSGARRHRVLLRHVLPNALGPVWALAALEFAAAILAVSSLSFLGYGVQPPTPEWGAMVSDGRDSLSVAWWLTTIPGLAVAATVIAANRLSRALDGERNLPR